MRDLGGRVNASRVAIVFATGRRRDRDDDQTVTTAPPAELFRAVHDHYSSREDIPAQLTPSRFVVLHHLPDREDEHAVGQAAVDARQLILKLRSRHKVDLRAALGSVGHTIAGLRPSLHDAQDALALGRRVDETTLVHRIDHLRVHQVLRAAGRDARSRLGASYLAELRTLPDRRELTRSRRLIDSSRAAFAPRPASDCAAIAYPGAESVRLGRPGRRSRAVNRFHQTTRTFRLVIKH